MSTHRSARSSSGVATAPPAERSGRERLRHVRAAGVDGHQQFNWKGSNANKAAADLSFKSYASVQGAEKALGIDIDEIVTRHGLEKLKTIGDAYLAVGGVPELVRNGENGLLVPAGDAEALADAIRQLVSEPGLRERLAERAPGSVEHLRTDRLYSRLEEILQRAAAR